MNLALQIYTKRGIIKENIFPNKKILHIGCGNSKLKGAIGIDMIALPAVDIVHDLDSYKWPIEDNSIDIFFAHSIVEHLDSLPAFFKELYRVGKDGARVIITVPYFRSVDSFIDPTHKHFFTSGSLDYFINGENSLSNYQYIPNKLKKIGFWYGWPQTPRNPLTRLFKAFIHRFPRFYDQYLSLLVPVKVLIWELEINK